jgi:hypothetical protein
MLRLITRVTRTVFVALALVSVQAAGGSAASGEKERRVALVIGNSNYEFARQLPNARNDADTMTVTLERLNFQVFSGRDLKLAEMKSLIGRFQYEAKTADVALIYFAGHGVQFGTENKLLAVDASTLGKPSSTAQNLYTNTYDLTAMVAAAQPAQGLSIVFLDACRDNPLEPKPMVTRGRNLSEPDGSSVAVSGGLIPFKAVGEAFIAFATEPGKAAADGDGFNSPFTKSLLKHLDTADQTIDQMMKRVRADVMGDTATKQIPWTNVSMTREFMFNPNGQFSKVIGQNFNPVVAPKSVAPKLTEQCETKFFEARSRDDKVIALSSFLETCGTHSRAEEAKRLRELAHDNEMCDRVLKAPTSRLKLRNYLDDNPQGGCAAEVRNILGNQVAISPDRSFVPAPPTAPVRPVPAPAPVAPKAMPAPVPLPASEITMKILQNRWVEGSGYSMFRESSQDACFRRCELDSRCRMAEFYFGREDGGRKCNLFDHEKIARAASKEGHVAIKKGH